MDRWLVCNACGATKRLGEFYASGKTPCQPCAACCDRRVRASELRKGRVIVEVTPRASHPTAAEAQLRPATASS